MYGSILLSNNQRPSFTDGMYGGLEVEPWQVIVQYIQRRYEVSGEFSWWSCFNRC